MDPVLARPIPADGVAAPASRSIRTQASWRLRLLRLAIAGGLLLAIANTALFEMRTSNLQALIFSTFGRRLSSKVESGAAPAVLRYPDGGPHDARLGYSQVP